MERGGIKKQKGRYAMSTIPQLPDPALSARISLELRRLGVSGHLRGSSYLAYMLGRAVPDPEQLRLITKNLYPDTGRHFGATTGSVERNVRSAVHSSWARGGRSVLEGMADATLEHCPTVSQFLHIVTSYIRRTS